MRKIILTIIAVFYLFACSTEKTDEKYNIDCTITIDNGISDRVLCSSLFDSVKYIPLETSDDILIKELTKVKFYENKIFAFDRTTQTMFSFDIDGKLIWQFRHFGSGPREYTQALDVDVDEESRSIYLLCRYEKIQRYDMDGNFIEERPIRLNGWSFATGKNKMYVYSGGRPNQIKGKDEMYNLLVINEKNVINGKIPIEFDLKAAYTYNSPNAFCKFDGEVRFFFPFSNNIYSIANDSIYIKYHLDFGKYNRPDKYFINNTMDDLKASTYAYGLNSFWENSDYFSLKVIYNQAPTEILYSKKYEKLYTGSLYDDIAYCFPNFIQAHDAFIVGARNAEDLIIEYDYQKNNDKGTLLKELCSKITPDDNPVVFLYYFKK